MRGGIVTRNGRSLPSVRYSLVGSPPVGR
jgi:hypothetical protein